MVPPTGSSAVDTMLSEHEWVRRVARALATDASAADDLAQEAWLAAIESPPRRGSLRAWFRTVLRHGAFEEHRSGRRREARERRVARGEAQASALEIVARAEAHRRVVECVLALDEPWRTTVVLRYFEDLTPAEIGLRLGLPADTIRARLRRAHGVLRERLGRNDGTAPSWLLVLAPLPAATPGPAAPFLGGTLMANSPAKSVALVVALVACAAGLVLWAWDEPDDIPRDSATLTRAGTSADGTGTGASRTGPRAGAASPASPTEDGRLAAAAGRSSLHGDVRYAAGDRAADGVVVELRGPGGSVRAHTDAQGAFRFDALPAGGPLTLATSAPSCADARVAGIHLVDGESRRVGTLWLDAPVRAHVRVVAPDGAPIATARVGAFLGRSRIERQDWAAAPPEPVETVTTDATGRASFAGLGIGDWTFRAEHPEYAPGGVGPESVLRGGVTVDFTIRLERGHGLSGTVSDAAGTPLEGAVVLALRPVAAEALMRPRPLDPLGVETRTDRQGRYEFRALAGGEHSIAVVLPGTLPARAGVVSIPSVSTFDVRLDGAALTGRVTEEGTGRPLAGARVRAAVWRRHSPTYMSALTDSDGRYVVRAPLGGILQGPARGEGAATALPVHFDVELDGYAYAPEAGETPWRNVWVFGAREATLDAVLRPAATLEGTVTGPDGPVGGAEVVADVWSELRGSIASRATSGPDGRFRFAGLPQGRARLVVTRDGYYQAASPGGGWRAGPAPDAAAVVEIPSRGTVSIDVRLERGGLVRGRVTDAAGAPVAAAVVESTPSGAPARRTASDADGAFALAGIRPGSAVVLRASRPGYVDATADLASAPTADSDAPVQLVLARSGSARGRVAGPAGGPVPGAWVQVAPAALALDTGYEIVGVWQRVPRSAVAADGTFDAPIDWLGGAATGAVVVRAGADGCAPALTDRLPVADGVADAGTVTLGAAHRLEGRIVAADGSGPVAGAEIEFQNERLPPGLAQRRDWSQVGRDQTPFEVVARSDADGRFVIDGLPPWRYELRVNAAGFGGAGPVAAVPQESPLSIELPRLAPLSGRVEWEDGSPGAQIAVLAHWTDGSPGLAGFTETAADGTFELPFLPAGTYRLEARRPSDRVVDVLPTTTDPVEGGRRDVRIVVRRGGERIAGRCLTEAGAAVPGAVIQIRSPKGGAPISARSGPDGRFEAAGLTGSDTWTLTGVADRSVGPPSSFGRRLVTDSVDAATGARDVLLVFRAAAPIAGRVVREDGGVPAGALMVQARRGADSRWSQSAGVGTDGAFQLASTSAGPWTLGVVDRSTGTPVATIGPVEFVGGTRDVRLVVASSTGISGRVTDRAGRAVEGARVTARPSGGAALETVSDAAGRFAFTGLAAGRWEVAAADDVEGRTEVAGVEPGGPDVVLVLTPSDALSARVVAPDGTPVRGADVAIADSAGRVVARLRTDSDGRFATRALAPGEYAVSVTSRGGATLPSPIAAGTVRPGAPETVLRLL